MSLYSPKMLVTYSDRYYDISTIRAEDIYIVDTCEKIPGRTCTIVSCTNIVSGQKKQFASNVLDNVSPNLAKRLLEQEIKHYSSALVNMQENLNLFQEID